MYKFRYKLDLEGSYKKLTIFEQDSEIFQKFRNKTIFTASNGYKFKTYNSPEVRVEDKVVFLMGNESSNSTHFKCTSLEFVQLVNAFREFDEKFCKSGGRKHFLTSIFK